MNKQSIFLKTPIISLDLELKEEDILLIQQAEEWCLDGWQVADPRPEQLAAALLMEANSIESEMANGFKDHVQEYPDSLRKLAAKILSTFHPTLATEMIKCQGIQPN